MGEVPLYPSRGEEVIFVPQDVLGHYLIVQGLLEIKKSQIKVDNYVQFVEPDEIRAAHRWLPLRALI